MQALQTRIVRNLKSMYLQIVHSSANPLCYVKKDAHTHALSEKKWVRRKLVLCVHCLLNI